MVVSFPTRARIVIVAVAVITILRVAFVVICGMAVIGRGEPGGIANDAKVATLHAHHLRRCQGQSGQHEHETLDV